MRKIYLICITLFLSVAATYAHSTVFDDVKLTSAKKASLIVTASVYEGAEDERQIPLSGNFYLLSQSIVDLLKARKFQLAEETHASFSKTDEAYLEALGQAISGTDEESVLLSSLITDLIAENQIALLTTTGEGIGKPREIPHGDYYLFGYARIDDELFVWNLPVMLLPGRNRVEVDQYNADAVIDIY